MNRRILRLFTVIIIVTLCLRVISCDGKTAAGITKKISNIPSAVSKTELCIIIEKSLKAGDRELTVKIRNYNSKQYNILKIVSDVSEYAVSDGWYLSGWSYSIDPNTGMLRITDIDYGRSPVNCTE